MTRGLSPPQCPTVLTLTRSRERGCQRREAPPCRAVAATGSPSTTAPALHVVLHLEPLRRRIHDYAGGTLDSVTMLVIDHGRFLLQEPVSSPSDLLLDGPKVSNNGIRADLAK